MSSPPPTRFDPFIQAVARRAEEIYSKMGIRRDESQDLPRRKKNQHEQNIPSTIWEDTTDVSVIALQGFLEDLLGLKRSSHQDLVQALSLMRTLEPKNTQPAPSQPVGTALHAANAYRITGLAVHDENVENTHKSSSDIGGGVRLADDFGDAERDIMRGYLRDLGELERRGVHSLNLRRSLTFLESIDQAIKSAL